MIAYRCILLHIIAYHCISYKMYLKTPVFKQLKLLYRLFDKGAKYQDEEEELGHLIVDEPVKCKAVMFSSVKPN